MCTRYFETLTQIEQEKARLQHNIRAQNVYIEELKQELQDAKEEKRWLEQTIAELEEILG